MKCSTVQLLRSQCDRHIRPQYKKKTVVHSMYPCQCLKGGAFYGPWKSIKHWPLWGLRHQSIRKERKKALRPPHGDVLRVNQF